MEAENDKVNENYRNWYKNHREEFNKKRRERYAKDKKYRAKAIKNSNNVRSGNAKVTVRKMYRKLEYWQVEVFRIREVAEKLNRSIPTIRKWIADGLIPPSIFVGKQNVYTQHQIDCLKVLVEVYDAYRHNPPKLKEELEKSKAWIAAHWSDEEIYKS